MSGHVFVVAADLCSLACDALLVPTDRRRGITSAWRELVREVPPPDAEWLAGQSRVARVDGHGDDDRAMWLTNVGRRDAPIDWYVAGAVEFVACAAEEAKSRPTRGKRVKPLLALPVVGTGFGGAARKKGAVLGQLLTALETAATRHDVDVVLVTRDRQFYSAAQALRRRLELGGWSGALGDALGAEAKRLGTLADRGQLVLFIGAGPSTGAGLPDWDTLLDRLAARAGLGEAEREAVARIDARDRARLIAGRLTGQPFGQQVALELAAPRYALAHSLLASLPVTETATTNYDDLFERASADAAWPCRTLPYQPAALNRRWLLKMHGCVHHPEDIVLTREDYFHYGHRRAALAGIVQALLVTRHMLFVGFSLQDENFHRIALEVRAALGGASADKRTPLGTALFLTPDPVRAELWREDVTVLPVGDDGCSAGEAARRLEVFLDLVGLHACTGHEYLLEDDYEDALTPEEQAVKAALKAAAGGLPPEARATPAGRRLLDFVGERGWRG